MSEVDQLDTAREVILPWSAEVIDVSTPEGVTRALAEANLFYHELRRFQSAMKERLIAESDHQGKRILELAGRKVEVESADTAVEITWDLAKLAVLLELGLPTERWAELVTYSPSVDKRVANQLSRNPEYKRIIDAASVERKPRARRVTVKS